MRTTIRPGRAAGTPPAARAGCYEDARPRGPRGCAGSTCRHPGQPWRWWVIPSRLPSWGGGWRDGTPAALGSPAGPASRTWPAGAGPPAGTARRRHWGARPAPHPGPGRAGRIRRRRRDDRAGTGRAGTDWAGTYRAGTYRAGADPARFARAEFEWAGFGRAGFGWREL